MLNHEVEYFKDLPFIHFRFIQEGATRAIDIDLKQQSTNTNSSSSSAYSTPNNSAGYTKSYSSQSVPPKQEQMEKPLYRTASPAKVASRVATNNTPMRDDYGSPSTAHTPLSSSGRQDTYGGGASNNQQDLRAPVANKLSYSSPAAAPISNHMVSSTPEMGTPYGYKTHYNAENSPMWLSTTKDMTSGYNPKSYEDSLVEASRNLSFNSPSSPPPVNRIGDGAEQPDDTGTYSICLFF